MSISVPRVNITIEPALVNKIVEEQKILIVGQRDITGSVPQDTLVENVGNNNEQDALFGARSMLAGMVRAAKAYNKNTRMDALVLDLSGIMTADKAQGFFQFGGIATADGTLVFNIGSRKNYSFSVSVLVGDTAIDIGNKLDFQISGSVNAPFTSTGTADVTITAQNKGFEGNLLGLEVVGSVAGVIVQITAMTGGDETPDLEIALALVENIRYQTIVFPTTYYDEQIVIDFMNDRFNPPTDKILDGIAIGTFTQTHSNLINNLVIPALSLTENSQNFAFIPNRLVAKTDTYEGSGLFEIDAEISAQFGAVRALRKTPGANLSEIVISQLLNRDSFGGFHTSTLPYHNTPFKNLPVIDLDQMWTDEERKELTAAGFAVLGNNINNKEIIADDIVTRYLRNEAGDPDESFKFLNYVDQASTVREVFHNSLKEVYAQSRLTDGTLIPGFNMTNEDDIKAELLAIYELLANEAVVIAGPAAIRTFKNSINITVDAIQGLVTIEMLDPVVTQLRQIDVLMQLTFSLNS